MVYNRILVINWEMWRASFTHEWLLFFQHVVDDLGFRSMTFLEFKQESISNALVVFVETGKNLVVDYVSEFPQNKYVYWCDDVHHDARIYNTSIFQIRIPLISAFGNCLTNAMTCNHYAMPFYVKPLNINPRQQLLMSGAGGTGGLYTFRNWVFERAKTDHRIHVLPHHKVYGNEYASYVHHYVASVTSTLSNSYHYVFAKVFEIPATGSLLVVEDVIGPELKELGFFNMVNCILVNREDFDDKLDFILSNPTIIEGMRRRGQELVKTRHMLGNRLDEFEDIITRIIAKYNTLETDLRLTSV